MTAPTIGLGLVRPRARAASSSARRIQKRSVSTSGMQSPSRNLLSHNDFLIEANTATGECQGQSPHRRTMETGSWKLETGGRKSETGNSKLEIGQHQFPFSSF